MIQYLNIRVILEVTIARKVLPYDPKSGDIRKHFIYLNCLIYSQYSMYAFISFNNAMISIHSKVYFRFSYLHM